MSASSKKVIIAAFIGNGLIAVTKFVASAMTGSSAMLSEAIHSVVDTGNQVFLLFGLRQAKKPADEQFPFGHGKEIYFWSFVVSIMIFAVGAGVSLYEGIHHLIHPVEIASPYINYMVLGLSMVFEGGSCYFAITEFNKVKGGLGYFKAVHTGKDPSMFVVLFEDIAAMLGLIVAFVGIFLGHVTGIPYFDGAASVAIGLILACTAAWLAYETKSLLIGESANKEVIQGIRTLVNSHKDVEHVNEVLTMHMGPEYVLVNISVDFNDSIQAGDIETSISTMDREIKQTFPQVKRIFVEAEARR